MLKVLKWEFMKRLYEFKIYYLILLGITILSLVMPTNILKYSEMVALFSSLFGGVFFAGLSIYLIIATTSDTRKSYAILEKSISKKPWEIISAKLINNVVYLLILFATVKILAWILNRFSTENRSFLSLTIEYEYFIVIGFLLPLIILFYYLLAQSISFTKRLPVTTTVVLIVGTAILISYLKSNLFLDEVIFGNNIILNIFGIILSISLFFGCCILYERHYEL